MITRNQLFCLDHWLALPVQVRRGLPRGIQRGWAYAPGESVAGDVLVMAEKVRQWDHRIAKAFMEEAPSAVRDQLARSYRALTSVAEDSVRYARRALERAEDLEASRTLGLLTRADAATVADLCACAETIDEETSVTYNPVSSGHESGTIYFQIGTTRHAIKGARGTAQLTVTAQGIPGIRLTLSGLFTTPSTQTAPTPDYSAWQKPKVASKSNTPTFTIDEIPFVLREFSLDLGCQVEPRLLIGSESIEIVDKAELVSATVEAVPLGTYNPFAAAADATAVPIQFVHEATAGRTITLDIPAAVQRRLTALGNQQGILEWPLQFTPTIVDVDDQWTLTFT